jgi:hypothetical protein
MILYNLLRRIFGVNIADRMTNFRHWRTPPAENVDPPRIQNIVYPGESINWPEKQALEFINGITARPMVDGVMTGRPMQWGNKTFRRISWGYLEYGIKLFGELPNPARGWYWKTGHPVPMYDRHCIVREPIMDKYIFHETIQLDENVDPNNILTNNALGWGKFENGVLVDGKYSTATDNPAHLYVWTPWSKENPHKLALTVTNYHGADGDFAEGVGVKAGSNVVLGRDSESYRKMMDLGGECAILAQAAATYGAVIIDRGNTNSFAIQPGSQWHSTNIAAFRVQLKDFVYIQ